MIPASRLARWGLLESARREAVRDSLIEEIDQPPAAILAVLLQQWIQERGFNGQAALEAWLGRLRTLIHPGLLFGGHVITT